MSLATTDYFLQIIIVPIVFLEITISFFFMNLPNMIFIIVLLPSYLLLVRLLFPGFFKIYGYIFFLGLFTLSFLVPIITWVMSFLIGGLAGGLLFFIVNLIPGVWCLNRYSHYPDQLNEEEDEHDAIIVVHYEWWKRFPIYGGGIEKLIKFLDGNKAYRIYQCISVEEVRNVIQNPKTINLWIFSHGSIDGIVLNDGNLEYESLTNVEKKDFIAQLHCNHCGNGCNLSLVDRIGKFGCIPEGRRMMIFSRSDLVCCLSHYQMLIKKGKIR